MSSNPSVLEHDSSAAVQQQISLVDATPLEYMDFSMDAKRRKPRTCMCIDSVFVNTSRSSYNSSGNSSFSQLLNAKWEQVPVNTMEGDAMEEGSQQKRPRWQPPRRMTAMEEAALYTSPPRIRIGRNYQVDHLPKAGQRDNSQQAQEEDDDDSSSPMGLWDPQRAAAAMAAGQDIGAYDRNCAIVDIDWISIGMHCISPLGMPLLFKKK
jgi:hypothetical protein